MSLRYHEIAETNHRILNPFTDEKLMTLGAVCRLQPGQRLLDLGEPMERPVALPEEFLRELAELEAAYLRTSNPIEQSGFRGRLIVGDYGSRSRRIPARDVAEALRPVGLSVAGTSEATSAQRTRFAWVERPG